MYNLVIIFLSDPDNGNDFVNTGITAWTNWVFDLPKEMLGNLHRPIYHR